MKISLFMYGSVCVCVCVCVCARGYMYMFSFLEFLVKEISIFLIDFEGL